MSENPEDVMPVEESPPEEVPVEEAPPAEEQANTGIPEETGPAAEEIAPEQDQNAVVKVDFIDDGDDLEMDFALAGFKGTKMYPKRVTDPKNPPPASVGTIKTGQALAWSPEFTLADLKAMEPAALMYDYRVPEVRASQRAQIAAKRRRARLDAIESIRPKRIGTVMKAVGALRRLIGRGGPGSGFHGHAGRPGEVGGSQHQGEAANVTGTGQKVEEIARPAFVGSSVKLKELANPRTVVYKNHVDPRAWLQAKQDKRIWGTNQDTGEMVDNDAWHIGGGVVDSAVDAIEELIREQGGDISEFDRQDVLDNADWVDENTGTAYGPPNEGIVQEYINDAIQNDIENEDYEVARQVEIMFNVAEEQMGLKSATWDDLSKTLGLTQDEMFHMSNAEIDEAIQYAVGQRVVEAVKITDEDKLNADQRAILREVENYTLDYIRSAYDQIPVDQIEFADGRSARENVRWDAFDEIEKYYENNPSDYDYDYLVNELDVSPSDLRPEIDMQEELSNAAEPLPYEDAYLDDIEALGLPEIFDTTLGYGGDIYSAHLPDTGEIVAVMETRPKHYVLSDEEKKKVADRFGIDPSKVGDDYIYIALLAAKYPRQGYGTEAIMAALKEAHEQDLGITGGATMAASMYYAKMGAQYLSDVGVDEGGTAFWTNAQVHAAYNWMTSQVEAYKTGELSEELIQAEQAAAEAKPLTSLRETPVREPSTRLNTEPPTIGTGVPGSTYLASLRGGIHRDLTDQPQYRIFENPEYEAPVIAVQTRDETAPHGYTWEIVGADGTAYDDEVALHRDLVNSGWLDVASGRVGSPTFADALTAIEPNSDLHREVADRGLWVNDAWNPEEGSPQVQPIEMDMAERAVTDERAVAIRRLAELIEAEPAVLFTPRDGDLVDRHYGPGPHPGTGTPQEVHGGGISPAVDVDREALSRKRPSLLGQQITLEKLAKIKANPIKIMTNDFSDRKIYERLLSEAPSWSNVMAGNFAAQAAKLGLKYIDRGQTIEEYEREYAQWVADRNASYNADFAKAQQESLDVNTVDLDVAIEAMGGLTSEQVFWLRSQGLLQEWLDGVKLGKILAENHPNVQNQIGRVFQRSIKNNYASFNSAEKIRDFTHGLYTDAYDLFSPGPSRINNETIRMLASGEIRVSIGTMNGEPVSTMTSEVMGGDELYVATLASKYPGHGHGTQMMLEALKIASENGYSISGDSLSESLPFYKKLASTIMGTNIDLNQDDVKNAYTWLKDAFNYLGDIPENELGQVIQTAMPMPGEFPSKPTIEQMEPVIERHLGPGPHPSGSPQEVHAGKGGSGGKASSGSSKTSVGITSARPGSSNKAVFEDMRGFSDKLGKIKSVSNAKVEPGLGGWEGGQEPTWVVSYEGNGEALKLLAETAKNADQDAVLLMREGGNSVRTEFTFTDPVTPDERSAVQDLLVEMGIGGWTWYRQPGGGSTLRAVAVPQWGGNPNEHKKNTKKLRQMLEAINMPHEYNEGAVDVDVMEREGANAYDTVLAS